MSPNFGYGEIGGSSAYNMNVIQGPIFTCPEVGIAESISWYGRAAGKPVKAAIYRHRDGKLIGSTEPITVGATPQWWKFNFLAPKPSLEAGVEYVLAFWTQGAYFYYDAIGRGLYKGASYDSWPDPIAWEPEETDLMFSIFCTYTPVAPPPTHMLRVESEPISVPVNLNGAPIGNTPVEADVEEGTHVVGVPGEVST